MREAEKKRLEREKWSDEKLLHGALDGLNQLSYDVSQISYHLGNVIVELEYCIGYLKIMARRRSATTGGQLWQKKAAGHASTASTNDATAEQVSTHEN